jgi:hypothetical protein
MWIATGKTKGLEETPVRDIPHTTKPMSTVLGSSTGMCAEITVFKDVT